MERKHLPLLGAMAVLVATAIFGVRNERVKADDWPWCCSAADQCALASKQTCVDSNSRCDNGGTCCVNIFKCNPAGS